MSKVRVVVSVVYECSSAVATPENVKLMNMDPDSWQLCLHGEQIPAKLLEASCEVSFVKDPPLPPSDVIATVCGPGVLEKTEETQAILEDDSRNSDTIR